MGSIKYIPLLIFFIYFPHSYKALVHSSSVSRCIESDRKALLEFKANIVNGSSILPSWTGSDCCTWEGITCHNFTGHVQALRLVGYKINSTLSPWLFNLSRLEVLNLDLVGFRGSIPNMFDKLTSLTAIALSGNSFDSPIFPDSLCSLTTLTYINLIGNQLQGSLPLCLGNITSLRTLILDGNKLSGELPGSLGFLTNLIKIHLSGNNFSSIPSTFGNLLNLESLDLANNNLSGTIPSTLGNLTKLKYLDVSYNSLSGELSEFFFQGLKSLGYLDIHGNQHLVFNVTPQWIPTFQIQSIRMDSIFIGTEFPPWLQTQKNLAQLMMSNASISGALPDWFLTAFPNLTSIDLSYNLLTGSIPNHSLSAPTDLVYFDLSNNFFTGSIPIYDSAWLEYLVLSGNHLNGNIPQQLCNLTSLELLSLEYNNLTGSIPSCLGALSSLSVLDLGNNNLSGHIPNELGSMSYLYILHLNGNKFSGEVPESLQNLTHLATLDLGQNELQGSIPPWIGKNWSSLQYLRLESNNISGEIPVTLCQLPSLQIMNLALNNLVGTIPPCFGNLSMMMSEESGDSFPLIALNEPLLNVIKGMTMTYTSSLPYAKFISLSGNHLRGEIPTDLMNLKGLKSLNLSNNELTGMIPGSINNLKQLESLDLSMNKISGTIPQSLANIDALSYLNLSFNNLVGKVPSGNHFDTLNDPSIYRGNSELCGKVLMKRCPVDDSATSNQPIGPVSDADEEFEFLWLIAGTGPGFAVGFLTVMCILYFKESWRIAYFGVVDNVCNKVRVTFTTKIS